MALVILRIIALSLEFAVEAIKSMTPEQRAAFVARHEERMDFWKGLWERFQDKD